VTVALPGDIITYTICITNCGDIDLEHITVIDTILGDLSASFSDTLAIGDSECRDFTYVMKDTDPDPLINCVTVHADPIGPMTNDIWDEDCETVYRPCMEVDKQVRDPDTGLWRTDDIIYIELGTILTFKITIENCGNGPLTNVLVIDTMSEQLQYHDNANYPELSVSPDLREVKWIFPVINPGETIEIIFEVESVQLCMGWNHVVVTSDQGLTLQDTVEVKNIVPPITIDKKVKVGNNWADSATLYGQSMIQFRIVVTNGPNPLTNVKISDDLPSFLKFIYSIGIYPSTITSNHIEWIIPYIPPFGQVEIEYFTGNYMPYGNDGYNYAYVEGDTGTGIISDNDSVHIIC
jgi:uncharacterized repeat protein (TIGR01451 family)